MTSPAPNTDPQIDEAVAALQKRMADAPAPFLGKPHCAEASRQELIKAVERFFSVDENLVISATTDPLSHRVNIDLAPKTALGAPMIQRM
jgi:hypothetical protein